MSSRVVKPPQSRPDNARPEDDRPFWIGGEIQSPGGPMGLRLTDLLPRINHFDDTLSNHIAFLRTTFQVGPQLRRHHDPDFQLHE